jgi:UDP-N-acetylmuramate dehydrogenase
MSLTLQENVDLQPFNTLAVPARAGHFVTLDNPAQTTELLSLAGEKGLPVRVLGGGSNIVLGDNPGGLWVHQCSAGRRVLERGPETVLLEVAAGENWHSLVEWTLANKLYGLENLALIPGTVGAAPIQNVGAYGVELAQRIEAVVGRRLPDGAALQFTCEECEFGYRDSIFKRALKDRVLIEKVVLRLSLRPDPVTHYPSLAQTLEQAGIAQATPDDVFAAVVSIRRSKLPDPAVEPNAGSFFKNPVISVNRLNALLRDYPQLPSYPQASGEVKIPAAWLIDACGYRQREAAVQVHRQHALVIVNPARRPGPEIMRFAQDIASTVHRRFEIELEREPSWYE